MGLPTRLSNPSRERLLTSDPEPTPRST
jgi:hypothetical protein